MRWALPIGFSLLLACVTHQAAPAGATSARETRELRDAEDADTRALAAIRSVHGGAGPWVVAGYRMGNYALGRLGLPRGSFDLEIVHHSPAEVQYSCIADGAAAATGASLGRLNLSMQPAEAAQTRTTFRNRRTGASLTLQATSDFAQRFLDVPRSELAAAGAEVLHLPDAAIFREVEANPADDAKDARSAARGVPVTPAEAADGHGSVAPGASAATGSVAPPRAPGARAP